MTVWQPTPALGSSASAGATDSTFDFVEVDRAAADLGERVARDGVRIAQQAGLHAKPVAVEATGPVWKTIVEIADRHDAATIVMGSRGLTGLRPMLLGSVSSAIVHHADRPTLIIRQSTQQTGRSPQPCAVARMILQARGIACDQRWRLAPSGAHARWSYGSVAISRCRASAQAVARLARTICGSSRQGRSRRSPSTKKVGVAWTPALPAALDVGEDALSKRVLAKGRVGLRSGRAQVALPPRAGRRVRTARAV